MESKIKKFIGRNGFELKIFYHNLEQRYKLDDKKIFHNPNFLFDDVSSSITWKKRKTLERFDNYNEFYEWTKNNYQYSLMLFDESYFQFYFESEKINNKFIITKGSMAFLPNPEKYIDYLRMDVDFTDIRDYNHNAYHIHFGYKSNDLRISLFKFPLPSEFIDFILSNAYNIVNVKKFKKDNFIFNLDAINNLYNHKFDFFT